MTLENANGRLGRPRKGRIFDPAPSADHKCASPSAIVAGSALGPVYWAAAADGAARVSGEAGLGMS
jgi:hypothetical protein